MGLETLCLKQAPGTQKPMCVAKSLPEMGGGRGRLGVGAEAGHVLN